MKQYESQMKWIGLPTNLLPLLKPNYQANMKVFKSTVWLEDLAKILRAARRAYICCTRTMCR